MVEEFIKGKDTTCTVVEGFRGERIYALLPTGCLSVENNKRVEEMTKKAHEILGLRHYSSSNFIITPQNKIYILETDSLPVFHDGSHIHNSLKSIGWRPREFVDHVLDLVV